MKVNLHVYPSPYKFETRMHKEAMSLLDMQVVDKIIIGASRLPDMSTRESRNGGKMEIWRIGTPFDGRKQRTIIRMLAIIFFNIRAYFTFRKLALSYINCHSLWLFPLCVALKKATGAKLIYDAHELETEREGLSGVPQKFARYLEKSLIRYADHIIVVGDKIARWYENRYGLTNVTVVRNIPARTSVITSPSRVLRENFSIPDDHIIFIYQGVLSPARGIDTLLQVFSKADPDKHLVLMGFGVDEEKVQQAAARYPNIHFQPAVPLDQLIKYTASADVGVFFLDHVPSLSYQYCLPNKFFEFLYAGLPVLMSPFPEMEAAAAPLGAAWVVNGGQEGLAEFVAGLTKAAVNARKPDISSVIELYTWEQEAEAYRDIYASRSQGPTNATGSGRPLSLCPKLPH